MDKGLSIDKQCLKKVVVSTRCSNTTILGAERPRCAICKGEHWAYKCDRLIKTTISERKNIIRSSKLCFNCLRPGHYQRSCTNLRSCKTCNKKHHTLLHEQKPSESIKTDHTVINVAQATADASTVLLSTAIIHVTAADGKILTARALLDSGSMSNFITNRLAEKLKLDKRKRSI